MRPSMQMLKQEMGSKEKVVFVMGATGTGKSKLSVDLACHFSGEIINSDKIQIYRGLEIVTNKITLEEQRGIPHHLLSIVDSDSDFDAESFCQATYHVVESVISRRKVPVIVGGSNSYIEALVEGEWNDFGSKYDCLFLWVDVEMAHLEMSLGKRVDKMMEMGMLDELRGFFDPKACYSASNGIRAAVGVPEFERYLECEALVDNETRRRLLKEAVDRVKDNTRTLACRQIEKIQRLRKHNGWSLNRLDATQVFAEEGKEADEAWSKLVAQPSIRIVSRFLDDFTQALPSIALRPYEMIAAKTITTTR